MAIDIYGYISIGMASQRQKKMLRPWSQQAQQLTLQRGTVAHLGKQGCCVHIHTGNLSPERDYLLRTWIDDWDRRSE